ncbi:hypothetical protein AMTR_s00030p00104460, partial [Amborella trichopoda]
ADDTQPLNYVHVPLDVPAILPTALAYHTREMSDADHTREMVDAYKVELSKIGKMVDDMGMDCDIPIGVFFEEVKARKKEGVAKDIEALPKDDSDKGKSPVKKNVKFRKEMQSPEKKKESSKKIYYESRSSSRLASMGIIKTKAPRRE